MHLNVPVRQQQVDHNVDRQTLHVVQPLLDAAQLGRQLHAGVQLPSLPDLVQDRLSEVLAVRGEQQDLLNSNLFKPPDEHQPDALPG